MEQQTIYRTDLLRLRLAELNWTQEKLAEVSQLNPNTISKIMAGGIVKVDTLNAVANALQIPLSDLFQTEQSEPQQKAA